ncbi:hypothetical protein [Aeromicrobium wangtongii]|uniref:Uncharacterized protein n=1 Tax=Aeromicrobium wangtongii TaxID=2969247 RepID=A0ABY5MEK1_9ACTN|nr:hypothetical protein [Aeromicrobium wangtongii]MCD9197863.1 hypothetical protein [Aeromicrobium wangtongii]UUP15344.1 hypothetical protein NQV15_08530 [Aeromicrobium wangtongii]
MTDQHVVELDGVRLTRLPAGRAEGFVWLSFVGKGEALRYVGSEPIDWRLRQHVTITWPDGTPGEIASAGSGGGDGMSFFDVAVRDTGDSSIVLSYAEGTTDLVREVVPIPA